MIGAPNPSKPWADGELVVCFVKGTTQEKAKEIVESCGATLRDWTESIQMAL